MTENGDTSAVYRADGQAQSIWVSDEGTLFRK